MLILLKGRKQSKQHMKGLHCAIAQSTIHWNIDQVAHHLTVVFQRQIDFLRGRRNVLEQFLHLLRPYLHQRVNIRHRLGVAHWRRLHVLVHVPHWVYPVQNIFWFFLSLVDGVDVLVLAPWILYVLGSELKIYLRSIRLIQGRFVLHTFLNTST